jgi:hypothetical protein
MRRGFEKALNLIFLSSATYYAQELAGLVKYQI